MAIKKMESDMNILQKLVIPGLDTDMDIIQKLDDEPNDVGGLTAQALKAKFDESGNIIQHYINETLLPKISGTVAEEENRAKNEQTRQEQEQTRQEQETARQTAENARAQEESTRRSAEAARQQAESARDTAETARANAENKRDTAEKSRVSAETGRVNAESARVTAESQRANAESVRAQKEAARISAETGRADAEADRVSAEDTRIANENARKSAETDRASAETVRESGENARKSAEKARASAEQQRESTESTRQTAEQSRTGAETARANAEKARADAETARVSAEQARATAESKRAAAETARQNAETVRTDAETKRVSAENARATAEGKRADAETARATAETKRVSAENARANAESTRQTNETARVSAEKSRSAAETARQTAEKARNVWEEYSAGKAYVPGNKVSFNGSSYVCTAATTGHAPTDTEYWLLIAKKGADGDGKGDMVKATYDPDGKETDVYRYVDDAVAAHNKSSSAHADIRTAIGKKQDAISDLATIRSGAAKGATAVQKSVVGKPSGVAGLGTDGKVPEEQLPSYVKTADRGKAGGVASLDASGKVPEEQLPSFVKTSDKGAAGGVASLDASGKVPSGQLPEMKVDAFTKAETLKDTTAALFGLGSDAVPDDVFDKLSASVLYKTTPKFIRHIVDVGNASVGNVVQFILDGKLTEFIVGNHGIPQNSNLYDASCNGTWVFMKEIDKIMSFGGSNNYASSNVEQELNSTFLNRIDSKLVSAIKQVKIPYFSEDDGTLHSGAEGLLTKVFLLSAFEVGEVSGSDFYMHDDGAKLDYFESGQGTSANSKRIAKYNNSVAHWWLRTPRTTGSNKICEVNLQGQISTDTPTSEWGVRPCMVLPTDFEYVYYTDQDGNAYSEQEYESILTDINNTPIQIPSSQILGGAQIETGSYVGTGSYGSSNPNSLTFGFVPKIFIVMNATSGGVTTWGSSTAVGFLVIRGVESVVANVHNDRTRIVHEKITWNEKTVSWYARIPFGSESDLNASCQLNNSGETYRYIAIG